MTRAARALVALVVLAAVVPARADPPAPAAADAAPSDDDARWGAAVVPRFTLSSDDGFGAGLRGSLFRHRFGQKPYKTAISFQAFATTKLVQHHFLRVDALDAFNVPLRVTAEVGWFQTLTFNFCGAHPTCDAAAASAEAARRGLVGDEAERFARRYFLARFVDAYADATARWRFGPMPHKPEVFTGFRADLYVPGDFGDEDGDGGPDWFPYPGSAFAEAFPDGQRGFVGVLVAGASLDGRDDEPDPSRGYFVEASLRGAPPLVGGRFLFGGANATALVYAPLLPERRLVLASRLLLDALVGDAPLVELSQVGGSKEAWAFGGPDLGRGLRQQRFPGKYKLAVQHELRSTVASFRFVEQDFRLGLAAFVDVGSSTSALDGLPPLRLGVGVGLRLVWNGAFVMRVDVAASPVERYAPLFYTKPDHPY